MFRPTAAIALCLALQSCHGDADGDGKPDAPFKGDLPAAEELGDLDALDASLVDRLLTRHLDAGFVVSLTRGDAPEVRDRGDSALFTGLAVAALGCDEGRPMFEALVANVRAHGGMIHRHPNLVLSGEGRRGDANDESSRDMMLGAALGLAVRAKRCPDDADVVRETWALHRAYVLELGDGRLYPGAGNDKQINGGLVWLWDKVANALGASGDAPRSSKAAWEAGFAVTPGGPVATKSACYPIHLAVVEALVGYAVGAPVSSFSRLSFCQQTRGAGLPVVEWFCEREPARNWLATYAPDGPWIYRHQRCRWEDPDADETTGPGVDFLLLKRLAQRAAL